jgi:hypothetical protein
MASSGPASRARRLHLFANQAIKRYTDEIEDEIGAGERYFSRRRLGARREQIRETRDRLLPGRDGVRAFWPEAAKNLPLDSSEPENVRILLRKIQAKLD